MTPTTIELRTRAADVLAKLVTLYANGYPGLVPRLLSTFKKALTSSPFPSPLGSDYPPAGRYEGAVLGIGACGAHAVREAIWGTNGDGLRSINDLIGLLYPGEGRRNKAPLVRATMRALQQLTTPKPEGATVPPPDSAEVAEVFGPHFVRAFEKRPWQAQELMRLRKGSNGDAAAVQADAAGEEDEEMEEVQA